MMWTIGEIIVEKSAAGVTVVVRRSNEAIEDLTKDDKVVHYTTKKRYELCYAYPSGKRYAYCMKSALTTCTPNLENEKAKHDSLPQRVQLVIRRRGTFNVLRSPNQSRIAKTLRWLACGDIRSGVVGLKQCHANILQTMW